MVGCHLKDVRWVGPHVVCVAAGSQASSDVLIAVVLKPSTEVDGPGGGQTVQREGMVRWEGWNRCDIGGQWGQEFTERLRRDGLDDKGFDVRLEAASCKLLGKHWQQGQNKLPGSWLVSGAFHIPPKRCTRSEFTGDWSRTQDSTGRGFHRPTWDPMMRARMYEGEDSDHDSGPDS